MRTQTYRARHVLARMVEGKGRRIRAYIPRHCGCERCVRGLIHLPLQAAA